MKPSFALFFLCCSYQDPEKPQLYNQVNIYSRWKTKTSAEPRRRHGNMSSVLCPSSLGNLLGMAAPLMQIRGVNPASNRTRLHDLK